MHVDASGGAADHALPTVRRPPRQRYALGCPITPGCMHACAEMLLTVPLIHAYMHVDASPW